MIKTGKEHGDLLASEKTSFAPEGRNETSIKISGSKIKDC